MPEERSYSVNINDHVGFLYQWTSQMKKKNYFTKWSYDELLSQSFVTAAELLKRNYDPNKGTVVTFFKAFLWPRVSYAYGKSFGWRYRDSKWCILESHLDEASNESYLPHDNIEYPEDLTPKERMVIHLRMGGLTYQSIAEMMGYKSANTVTYWIKQHIRPKFERVGLLDTI